MQKVIIWRYPHHTLTNLDCKPEREKEKLSFDRSTGDFCGSIRHFATLSVTFAVLSVTLTNLSIAFVLSVTLDTLSVTFAILSITLALSVILSPPSTSSTKKIHTTNRQRGTFSYLFYRADKNAFTFIFWRFVSKI